MERQGGFDVVQVNEAVNFAIGITGDVGDGAVASWHFRSTGEWA